MQLKIITAEEDLYKSYSFANVDKSSFDLFKKALQVNLFSITDDMTEIKCRDIIRDFCL